MHKDQVLVTDRVHPLLIRGLGDLGYAVDHQPDISQEQTLALIGAYQGIIINSKIQVNKAMLAAAPALQFVGRLGSGLEIIDLPAAAALGVVVFSAPEGNCNAVAEHALGMLLTLSNRLLQSDRQVRQFLWERESNRGWELAGKAIGIIGMGHTGRAFAKKLQGLELHVLGHDKYDGSWVRQLPWVTPASKEEICTQADIISIHLPLTLETKHYVDMAFIKNCRKGLVLLNTARGNQVVLRDLIAGLQKGLLGGACLDVFENERPETMSQEERNSYKTLYEMENVVLSPHVAGWTTESFERIARVLFVKISHWHQEKRLQGS